MKQMQKYGTTAVFGVDGKAVYMADVQDVAIARFVKVPQGVDNKSNASKHKQVSQVQK